MRKCTCPYCEKNFSLESGAFPFHRAKNSSAECEGSELEPRAAFEKYDRSHRLQAGTYISKLGERKTIWHTNSKGEYWTGYMPDGVAPEELLKMTLSTLLDLIKNHPELSDRLIVGFLK